MYVERAQIVICNSSLNMDTHIIRKNNPKGLQRSQYHTLNR